jgi:hypothetical protein
MQGSEMRVHTLLKRWRILLWPVLALGAGAGGCFYYFQPPLEAVSAAEHAQVSEAVHGTGIVEASVDRTRSMAYDAPDARRTVEDSAPSKASTPITRDVTNHATSARVPPMVNDARRIAAHKARWARSKVERMVAHADVKRITRIGRDFLLSLR